MTTKDETVEHFITLMDAELSRELQFAGGDLERVQADFTKAGAFGGSRMYLVYGQILGEHFVKTRQRVASAVETYLAGRGHRLSADVVEQRRAAALKFLEIADLQYRAVLAQRAAGATIEKRHIAEAVFRGEADREHKALKAELAFILPQPMVGRGKTPLAAILVTDIVDYTKLMAANESATIADVETCAAKQSEVVSRYRGKVFKDTGDGAMSHFASAVDALEAAIEIQREVTAMNSGRPPDRHIVLRAGLAVGDVYEADDGDIHGSCVIMASRIQPIATPGTICLPASVRADLASKVLVGFKDLGPRSLKGFSDQVRLFLVDPKMQPTKSAAEKADEALFNPERAYLTGGGDVEDQAGERLFRVEVANLGKIPAYLFAFDVQFATLEEVRAGLLPVNQRALNAAISPDGATTEIARVPITRPDANVVYGAFWYRDLPGKPDRESRFVLRIANDGHTRLDVTGVNPDYTRWT